MEFRAVVFICITAIIVASISADVIKTAINKNAEKYKYRVLSEKNRDKGQDGLVYLNKNERVIQKPGMIPNPDGPIILHHGAPDNTEKR